MHFVEDAEEEDQREILRVERRHFRDISNVFELPETEFRRLFRLSKDLARSLIEELTPHMDNGLRNTKVPITIRIMGALRFFAQGSYQRGIGNEIHVSMAQQTFSRALSEVCLAIEAIAPHWVTFPMTRDQKEIKKEAFMQTFGFPGTVGCIDCTHVAILEPAEDEHLFFNRKRYHSKNVQIICDTNLVILNVNASYGGATHDAFIWRNSAVRRHLEQNYERGDRNTWLIGDSGYPQEPWLMTPIRGMPPDSPEGRYTSALTRARNCVERCIGMLYLKFSFIFVTMEFSTILQVF